MESNKQHTETVTPAGFLDDLGQTLKMEEGSDCDLAEILRTHLLTATPAQNAVALAMKAILELASGRATSRKSEAKNG